ncbi:TPA: restriction endonuclease subunit S [Streptococcus suis]
MPNKDKNIPKRRFKEFENADAWELRKLGELMNENSERTSDFANNPLYSLTIENGITPKTERYERSSLVTKQEDLFKIVKPNEFVTNPMNLRFGALGYNSNSFRISVSGYYDVFSIDENRCSNYWYAFFKTDRALSILDNVSTGSLIEKRRVKYSTLRQISFRMPCELDEKIKIGNFFSTLDRHITLHQRKLDKLKSVKQAYLSEMFPAEGERVPKRRFPGFTDAWELRKLGEYSTLITKGTTPRDKSGIGVVNFVKVENLVNGDIIPLQKIQLEEHEGYLKRSQLIENDILFSIAGTLGRTAIVKKSILPANTNQALSIIRGYEFDRNFLVTILRGVVVREFIKRNPTIGAQPNLSLEQVSNLCFLSPCSEEQSAIGTFFSTLDRHITLHQRKLEKLKNLKKALLNELFV